MATFENLTNMLMSPSDSAANAIQALLDTPMLNPEDLYLQLERVVKQGILTPEQATAVLQEKSAMEGVTANTDLIQNQYQALQGLQDITNQGGLTAIDRARLDDIRREEQTAARGARDAILQNAAARGVGGGGLEMLQKAIADQQSAERASSRGTQVAAEAQKRALEALLQQGTLAGQIRTQQFGEDSAKALAADEISKFNLNNQQAIELANLQQRAQTNQLNLAEQQRIAELNAALQSDEARARVAAALSASNQQTDLAKALSSQFMGQAELGQRGEIAAAELTQRQEQSAAELAQKTSQANAELAQAERQMQINQALRERELTAAEKQMLADMGFKERELTLNEKQAVINQQLRQQEMSMQQQNNLATQGLRGRELDIGQSQGLASQSLKERELTAAQAEAEANRKLKEKELDIYATKVGATGVSNAAKWGEAITAAPAIISGLGTLFGGKKTPTTTGGIAGAPVLSGSTGNVVSGLSSLWDGGGSDGIGDWGTLGDIGGGISDMVGGAVDWVGSLFSDEDMKKNVSKLTNAEVDDILGNLTGYKYKYKDDPSGTVYPGVMAQDMEKSKLGNVQDTPVGKMVSYSPQDIHAMTAALANIHDRVKKIEGAK